MIANISSLGFLSVKHLRFCARPIDAAARGFLDKTRCPGLDKPFTKPELLAAVRQVLEAIGYFPVDLGSLVAGGQLSQLPFGSLSATNFFKI